jgi:hypothetical protein
LLFYVDLAAAFVYSFTMTVTRANISILVNPQECARRSLTENALAARLIKAGYHNVHFTPDTSGFGAFSDTGKLSTLAAALFIGDAIQQVSQPLQESAAVVSQRL